MQIERAARCTQCRRRARADALLDIERDLEIAMVEGPAGPRATSSRKRVASVAASVKFHARWLTDRLPACPTRQSPSATSSTTRATRPQRRVRQYKAHPLNYTCSRLTTVPRTTYLARISNPNPRLS